MHKSTASDPYEKEHYNLSSQFKADNQGWPQSQVRLGPCGWIQTGSPLNSSWTENVVCSITFNGLKIESRF